jgi:hypothetical protein
MTLRLGGLVLLVFLFWAGGAVHAQQRVDVALVLAADVSRSVDESEFRLQRDGIAQALTDPKVLSAIRSGMHGAVAVCFVEWSGYTQQAVVADWTVITDLKSAAPMATIVRDAPRSFAGATGIGEAGGGT